MSIFTNNKPDTIKQDTQHKKNEIMLFIFLILTVQISILYSVNTEERLNTLKKDFNNPVFISAFIIIICIIVFGIGFTKGRVRNAIRNGTTGFIISYLARLNLSFAVFFIVSVFAYSTDRNTYI